MILTTSRLTLRPITTDDQEFILKLVNTDGWLQFIGDRNIRSVSDAQGYIEKILSNEHFFYHVFESNETKQSMGVVTFLYRDGQDFPDIGFAILPEYTQKDYTYEASKRYLDELIAEKASPQILGITMSTNLPSIRLLEKLGLSKVEEYEDKGNMMFKYKMSL